MSDVQVQVRWNFTNKARRMDDDLRDAARAARAHGETLFKDAQLRPEDETWWKRLWEGISGATDGRNAYLLSLAMAARDTDRILHEGILMGDRVIRARNQLRAIVAAFGIKARCAKIVDPEE
jgi:hypothetical protein